MSAALSVERTEDRDLIKSVMTHPAVYRHLTDDSSPSREEYTPVLDPLIYYLAVLLDQEVSGVVMFIPVNGVCWDAHICLLPRAWGRAVEASRMCVDWMWSHTPCRRIIAGVPEHNRLVLRMARSLGMDEIGFNDASFLKDGILEGQHMFGLSAPLEV